MVDIRGRRRQVKGTPIGGQFAEEARTEPVVSLGVSSRVESAQDPNTPAGELARLGDDPSLVVRLKVAANPHTPAVTLSHMAVDDNWEIRRNVASNPDAPARLLELLGEDPYWEVRHQVAGNENTPQETLTRLGNDPVKQVREASGGNPNCPVEVKKKITAGVTDVPYPKRRWQVHFETPMEGYIDKWIGYYRTEWAAKNAMWRNKLLLGGSARLIDRRPEVES